MSGDYSSLCLMMVLMAGTKSWIVSSFQRMNPRSISWGFFFIFLISSSCIFSYPPLIYQLYYIYFAHIHEKNHHLFSFFCLLREKRGYCVFVGLSFFFLSRRTPTIRRMIPRGRKMRGSTVRTGDLNPIWMSAVMFGDPSLFMMNQMCCSCNGR